MSIGLYVTFVDCMNSHVHSHALPRGIFNDFPVI